MAMKRDTTKRPVQSKDTQSKVLQPKDSQSNGLLSKDLWIADRYSLKGPAGERAWENRPGGVPNSSRFLELADIALGAKKSVPHKKTAGPDRAHQTHKTEPYSNK